MTRPYDIQPFKPVLAVTCPDCGHAARFEFARIVRIKRWADVAYFEASPIFDYLRLPDGMGGVFHLAAYYPGLDQGGLATLDDLPDGYAADDWGGPPHPNVMDLGELVCSQCGRRSKHQLDWPEEAYFQIGYRGQVLWAFDRESAAELLDYVRSADRDRSRYQHKSFLLHVPSVFLTAKARATVVKRLERRLGGS